MAFPHVSLYNALTMKRRLPVVFLALSLLVFALAVGTGAYRVLSARQAAASVARSSFDALRREATARIRSADDAAGAEWNESLRARWDASPELLAVIVRDAYGIIQAVPASSPFIRGETPVDSAAGFDAPKASTLALGAVIGGDPNTAISIQALYSTITVGTVWKSVRDALLAIAVWLAGSSLILAATKGNAGERRGAVPPSYVPSEAESGAEAGGERSMEPREPFPWELQAGSDGDAAVPAGLPSLPDGTWDGDEREEAPPDIPYPEPLPVEDEGFEVDGPEPPRILDVLPAASEGGLAEPGTLARSRRFGDGGRPAGLYSPLSGLGWEAYLADRLDAELRRAAGFEQDLCVLLLSNSVAEAGSRPYGILAKAFVEFFTFRDLSFEYGVSGMAAVLPNVDVEHGLRMAEEFLRKVGNRLAEQAEGKAAAGLAIGISARAGRLVEASRVLDEARAALERAQRDGSGSKAVAFKPDPDRYRNFVAGAC